MSNPGERPASDSAAASRRGAPSDALRLALSLPGGIAPGTFEAGAVCGLLAWMQEVNAVAAGAVIVDVITGASAGALTGLLAARVLLAGDDPVAVYRQAWVSAPSLSALRAVGPWAPLSLRKAREVAHTLVFAPSDGQRWRQASPVNVDVALGCLRGFSQQLPPTDDMMDAGRPLLATSYLDWSTVVLCDIPASSATGGKDWTEAIDSVIASASHPLAFPARSLDRESYRERYLKSEVVNLPADEADLTLWYTDGGLLDNEPLGRCIARVGALDGARTPPRLVMLVRSSVRWPPPRDDPSWSGRRVRPLWTQTLARVLDLVATHATGRDLLRVELTNARLRWTSQVAAKLAELLHADDRDELERLLKRVEEERRPFDLLAAKPLTASDPASLDLEELIAEVLRAACGLAAKRPVDVGVVSADAAYTGPQALRSLVGFLERRQRENHFAAGYWSMLSWIGQAPQLAKHIPEGLVASAVLEARKRVPEPSASRVARDDSRALSARTRAELLRLGFRTGGITRADIDAFFDFRKQRARRSRQRVGDM